uniref:DNA repair protein REV1 n=1 Tax=Caenorhabditis japonica TaxID=281687 RepID=A0A8R1HKU3_CAEJA
MRSPDVFADDDGAVNSDDSFENFTVTPIRRRSQAIVHSENESFDFATGSEQATVIEIQQHQETVLFEEKEDVDSEETINRLLDSSLEEELEDIDCEHNDALSKLLQSFGHRENSNERQEEKEEQEQENRPNVSLDIFEQAEDNADEEIEIQLSEEPEDDEATLLPVALPDGNNLEPAPKRRRLDFAPSTSSAADGPVVPAQSDVGEYWNQNNTKTIEIHGNNFEINNFHDYMRMKITKLNHQVNVEKSKPFEKISEIFKNYSVYVNGYTEPPALVIRDLIVAHGGEYHCYYMHGRTTYNIASSLATAKIATIREKEIFIKSDWITESIAAGKPLDYRDFLIYEKGAQEKGRMREFFANNSQSQNTEEDHSTLSSSQNAFLDARNPNFIRDYYARSRLHLISTLAQDMKDFVANLKLEGKLIEKCFPEEELKQLSEGNIKNSRNENMVFHVDLDCFFVSVALRDRVDLKEKEVAITHSKGTISNSMSEIASCSYAARSCGVKNGMLVRDALQHCPNLTLLPYQFDDYVNVSQQIYEILASYTLELRAVSCDEMYINVGTLCQQYDIQDPILLAEHIRKTIRAKTRCPASVGIGRTSLLARLATRHAKPDGVYWVTEEKRIEFMLEEKIKDLPGLGYQMMDRLTACIGKEISTCGQLQQKPERELSQIFGPKLATKIFKQCRGVEEDSEDFWKTQLRKSVSCDINYGIRFTKREELLQLMRAIGAELERKLTDSKMMAGAITVKLMVSG